MYESPSSLNMSKGFGEMVTYINNVTNSWISNMILIAIWIIILTGSFKSTNDFGKSMGVAGFGTFIVALFFWLGGLISGVTLSMVIGMAIVGIIIVLVSNN